MSTGPSFDGRCWRSTSVKGEGGTLSRIIGLLTSMLIASACLAQDPAPASGTKDGIAKQFALDEFKIWTSPARIKKEDIGWVSIFAINTTMLLKEDPNISQEVAESG